jgi:Ca-activated chloride channel family protein
MNLAVIILLVALASSASASNGEPPSYSNELDMVRLNVSVAHGNDRFVTGLGPQDFVVLEDGIRQEVATFARRDVPLSLVLLLDGSDSMARSSDVLKKAASRLVDRLGPEDTAQVVEFSAHPTVLQDTTSDRDLLKAAIGRVHAEGATALHNVLYVTLKDMGREADDTRRRAVVLLTDGEDTASMISDDQVLEQARRSEIGVYSILLSAENDDSGVPSDQRLQAEYLLTALGRESGGEAFLSADTDHLEPLFTRIEHELHSQYSLGYVSNNPRHDGGWRQILVAVQRAAGVQVRHRLGYYAKPGS